MTGRVLVAATQVPFETGGAEWHTEALRLKLVERGFCADVVRLPFQWDPRSEVVRSCLAWRMLDLSRAGGEDVDLLIATRFPSYAVRHPNKVVWLFHPFRQAYDLHDAGIDGFPDTLEGRTLHRHVVELDRKLLGECRRLYTTSRNNAGRLKSYLGLDAEVLRLPLLDPEARRCDGYEDFVLSVGRLESLKRTDLLVRAARHLPAGARVVIVGEGSQRGRLEDLAEAEGVRDQVRFAGRLPDDEVLDLYARAGAVYYAPFDEDYGLVTLEALQSRKPVVTTGDSGGVLEFVENERTGLVAQSDPAAVGECLARLLGDKSRARALGDAGYDSIQDIRWDRVIDTLTRDLG